MPRLTTQRSRQPAREARAERSTLARRIVLGTFGANTSAAAVQMAGEIARLHGGRVHVVTAVEPFPNTALSMFALAPPPMVDESNRMAAEQTVRRQLRSVLPPGGHDGWTLHTVTGWPSEAILDEAERRRASMIVLGIGRHKPVDRYLGHETALAVIRRATVPVLAVSPKAKGLPRHALVTTDFTNASLRAARLAAEIMAPDGVITLAHVPPLAHFPRRDGVSWSDVYATGAEARIEALRVELHRATGMEVESVLLEGETVSALLDHAAGARCDLIAVGGHVQGFVDRMLIGSVTSRLLRGATCSVFVAPQRLPAPAAKPGKRAAGNGRRAATKPAHARR